jgi:hypothetical protein
MREPTAEAASVASQLLAFYREPVSHRPLYIHGREPLPGAHFVLRFAHGRFNAALIRELDPPARAELRNAALAFIRQVCFWDGATYYQLLCAEPGARREVLKRNYRLMVGLIHPDKRDTTHEPWPLDSAQRLNAAYETLADDQRRAEYDQGLRKVEHEHSSFVRVPAAAGRAPSRRTVGVLAAVVAPLIFAQVVWINGQAPEHSLLDSLRREAMLARDAMPPRFMGGGNSAASTGVSTPPDDEPSPVAPVVTETRPATALQMPAAAAPHPAMASTRDTSGLVPVGSPPPASPIASAPRAPEVRVAQVPANAPSGRQAPAAPVNKDVELLVARLVSAYEAGDANQLMSLYEGSFWQSASMQQSYANFFRATRNRRLRIDNLTWTTSNDAAHARGQATVIADYNDDTAHLERQIDVELDIDLAGGRARFTKLSLFPNRS